MSEHLAGEWDQAHLHVRGPTVPEEVSARSDPENDLLAHSRALPSDSRTAGRANGPVRQSMLQTAQQAHGNRAVQRALQQLPAGAATTNAVGSSLRQVSRQFLDDWEIVPKYEGDWPFLKPGETDPRYDNPQERERAEREDEDARRRGEEQGPPRWWEPQPFQPFPLPELPKIPIPFPDIPGVRPLPPLPDLPGFRPGPVLPPVPYGWQPRPPSLLPGSGEPGSPYLIPIPGAPGTDQPFGPGPFGPAPDIPGRRMPGSIEGEGSE